MLSITRIRAELQDLHIAKVARATGLHYNTLRDMRDNPDTNPKLRTMETISAYLAERDAGGSHDR